MAQIMQLAEKQGDKGQTVLLAYVGKSFILGSLSKHCWLATHKYTRWLRAWGLMSRPVSRLSSEPILILPALRVQPSTQAGQSVVECAPQLAVCSGLVDAPNKKAS